MNQYPKVINKKGKVCTLRTKRYKSCECSYCAKLIAIGTQFYECIIGGGGLGSKKFPDRVHTVCIYRYLNKK